MSNHRAAIGLVALLGLSASASAQFLMVPDSTADRIMVFNDFDGSAVNLNFIVDAGVGSPFDFQTPKDVIQVDNEIWVSDQLTDAIFRFNLNGSYIATITGGLDNIRGMAYAQGKVYVSNSGTNNGAPGQAVVVYAPNGTFSSSTAVPDPFDVHEYNGELLVSNIAGDNIERYDYGLNFLGTFFDGNGTTSIDFPQQLATRFSNGNLLAAGFSPPDGIYEFTSSGMQVGGALAAGTGPRGVHELGNGNIMYTNGSGVFVLNPFTGGVTQVATGSGQYINPLVPAPGAIALAGCAGLLVSRRRR